MPKSPRRSEVRRLADAEHNIPDFAGKKKKVLVVNTTMAPVVVNTDGQTVAGHCRAYVAANDKVAKGAINVGLLRLLSE